MKSVLSVLIAGIMLWGCNEPKKKQDYTSLYNVVEASAVDETDKAAVTIRAYLTQKEVGKDTIHGILKELYILSQNHEGIKKRSEPNYISIYLYSSKDMALRAPSKYHAIMEKTPVMPAPETHIHKADKTTPEYELYQLLTDTFAAHGLNFCEVFASFTIIREKSMEVTFQDYEDMVQESSLEKADQVEKYLCGKLLREANLNEELTPYVYKLGYEYCR